MDYTYRLDEKLSEEITYYPCDICTDDQQWQHGGAGRCHNTCPMVAIEYDPARLTVTMDDSPFRFDTERGGIVSDDVLLTFVE